MSEKVTSTSSSDTEARFEAKAVVQARERYGKSVFVPKVREHHFIVGALWAFRELTRPHHQIMADGMCQFGCCHAE